MDDSIYCDSCGAEFTIKVKENDDFASDDIQFCPFCGDDILEFDEGNDDDYGRLKTTIAQFFRISGSSNQYKGVVPDIKIPEIENQSNNIGERSYENALPWDEVRPAKYQPTSAPTEIFETAKIKHLNRIKEDRLFQAMLDNMNQNQKNDLKKEISLLEKDRIIEREKNEEAKIKLENMMRQEKGLAPLTDLDNISETSDDEPLDILLNEAAEILNDLIVPSEIRTVYK